MLCVVCVCVRVDGVRVCVLVVLVLMVLCVFVCVSLYACGSLKKGIYMCIKRYVYVCMECALLFLVGGVMRLVNSVDERYLGLLYRVKCDSSLIVSQRDFVCITWRSLTEPHLTHDRHTRLNTVALHNLTFSKLILPITLHNSSF